MATECQLFSFLAEVAGPSTKLDTTTWIALVLGAVATLYVVARAKMRAKKDPLERSPSTSSLSQQRAVERQMSNLLIELSEMARSVSAGLDTRAAKLEALLDEADKRIDEMKALTAAAQARRGPSDDSVDLFRPPAPSADFNSSEKSSPSEPSLSPSQSDDRHVEVYVLADQGRKVAEIAAALGRPSGEIELILALRPRPLATAE